MSEIVSTSAISMGSGMSVSAASSISTGGGTTGAGTTVRGTGMETPSGGGVALNEVSSGTRLTSTTQTLSYSRSSALSGGSSVLPGDRMSALVLALIAAILGLDEKDKEDKKILGGLVGLLALASGGSSARGLQSLEFSQSSQVVQMTTTGNTSAVQAASYDRSGSSVELSGGSTGGTLNVVG